MKRIILLMVAILSLSLTSYGEEELVIEGSSQTQTQVEEMELPAEKIELTFDEKLKMGKESLEYKNYSKALELYKDMIKEKPKNSDVVLGLGMAYEGIEEKKTALKYYEKAMKLKPRDREIAKKYLNLKGEFVGTMTERKREAYYRKYEAILRADKYESSDDIFKLGAIYMDDHSFERAYNIFRRDRHGDYRNMFGAASAANFLGKSETAIKFYKKAIEARPSFERSYLGISTAYKLIGDYDSALVYLKKSLNIKTDPNIYVAIANIYMAQDRYGEARVILEKGQKKYPNSPRIGQGLGEIYSRTKKK